ncbi:D-glycero-beta-D-manno-heptose 1,7-bisphosphate 7-phosphatase [Legionella sp.]|uniref:D-glycero-beta-D-manno-heptose 1,7-bisphosphate 7-phosphatase n=1 Tax=Legionella sp. TaxID=459 RepID=UPI0032203D23
MSKVILLDRDGVINQDSPNYIRSASEFIFLPGSVEAIARLTKAGYRIGIATNQSGLARGYYGVQELRAIHEKMLYHVRAAGGEIDAIEYCHHLPTDGCLCRKPNPGMLHALARQFDCTLNKVSFVGDKISDIEAAKAAGAMPVLVLSQMSGDAILQKYSQIPVFNSLLQYVHYLLNE